MKRTAKILLLGSVTTFALSLTGPGSEVLWGILKPVGALLFGAFFITNLVANEYAQYDQEQTLKQPARVRTNSNTLTPKTPDELKQPRLLGHAAAK